MIPEVLSNCAGFIDGVSFAGEMPSLTLPKVVLKTEAYRGGGMAGEVEIPTCPVDVDLRVVAAGGIDQVADPGTVGEPIHAGAAHRADDFDHQLRTARSGDRDPAGRRRNRLTPGDHQFARARSKRQQQRDERQHDRAGCGGDRRERNGRASWWPVLDGSLAVEAAPRRRVRVHGLLRRREDRDGRRTRRRPATLGALPTRRGVRSGL